MSQMPKLASFIIKTDGSRFQNELYRNVDFLITDLTYKPMVIIEINDQSHLSPDRRERDEKVCKICEEAGIPLIKLWTSYGVNEEYIRKRINEAIETFPLERVSHFAKTDSSQETTSVAEDASEKASALQRYTISPIVVKHFGSNTLFRALCQKALDNLVSKLHSKGIENTPYKDLY